jgi:hypothetical protein
MPVLARAAPETAEGEAGEPESKAGRGRTDHPDLALFRRERSDRDAREEDRQHEEECAEGTTLRGGHGGDSTAEERVYTPSWNL